MLHLFTSRVPESLIIYLLFLLLAHLKNSTCTLHNAHCTQFRNCFNANLFNALIATNFYWYCFKYLNFFIFSRARSLLLVFVSSFFPFFARIFMHLGCVRVATFFATTFHVTHVLSLACYFQTRIYFFLFLSFASSSHLMHISNKFSSQIPLFSTISPFFAFFRSFIGTYNKLVFQTPFCDLILWIGWEKMLPTLKKKTIEKNGSRRFFHFFSV